MESKTKYCVYCGEKIPINARKCRYCREWVTDDHDLANSNDFDNENNNTNYSSNLNSAYTDNNYSPNLDSNSNSNNISENINNINNVNNSNNGNNINNSNNPNNNSSNAHNNNNNNQIRNNQIEYSKILPMRKFILLMVFTLGLYSIYWFYKNNQYLRDNLGEDISVGFRTVAFIIIPIANIIVFYELLDKMKNFIEEKGIECYSPGLNTLILIFIPFIGYWVYVNVQESFNDFWRVQEPNLPVKRSFTSTEIVILILGIILWIGYLILVFSAP